MASTLHVLNGIGRTLDDVAQVPLMIDTGRPVDDAREAFKAATQVVLVAGLKGTLTAAQIVTWAALAPASVTVYVTGS